MNYPDFDANNWIDYRAASEAFEQGHYTKASRILQKAMAESHITGTIDPLLLSSASQLAERYFDDGEYSRAASLYRAVLDVRMKLLGPDHADCRETRRRLAMALWQTGGLTPKMLAVHQQ